MQDDVVRNLNYIRFCEIEEQMFFVCFCLSGKRCDNVDPEENWGPGGGIMGFWDLYLRGENEKI